MTFQPDDWANSYSIVIDHTKIDDDLYNFPITVDLLDGTGLTGFDASGIFDALDDGPSVLDSYDVLMFRAPTDSSNKKLGFKIDQGVTILDPGYLDFEVMFGFDGNDDAFINIENSLELDFEGDFTIEFWMKSTNSSTFHAFSFGAVHSPLYNLSLKFNDTYGFWLYWNGDGSAPLRMVGGTSGDYSDGAWRHFALVRTGQYFKLYVDATEVGRAVAPVDILNSGPYIPVTSQDRLSSQLLGAHSTTDNVMTSNLEGYLSGIRISQTARYTSGAFDLPTSNFVPDDYDVFILQEKLEYTDNIYNWSIYHNHEPRYAPLCVASEPFGRAINLDVNASSIYTEDNLGNFNIGEDGESFTVDFWAMCNIADASDGFFGLGGDYDWTEGGMQYGFGESGGYIYFRVWNGTTSYTEYRPRLVSATGDNPSGHLWRNEWNHYAAVNDAENNTFRIYFNGRELTEFTWTAITIPIQPNVGTVGKRFTIGAYAKLGWWGYKTIAEFRVAKGIARWQQRFVPPKAPYGNNAFNNTSSWHNRKKIAVTATVSGVEEECFVEVAHWYDGSYIRDFILYGGDASHNYSNYTSYYSTTYYPYRAYDNYSYRRGTHSSQEWLSANLQPSDQKFNVDMGRPVVVDRLYLDNGHSGQSANSVETINHFSVYGTNSSTAFDNITYSDTTDLTLIGTFQARQRWYYTDQPDPQFFDLTTSGVAYRYYVLRLEDNRGGSYMGIRHLHFQQTTKSARLYVKVPHISKTTGTELTLYYDKTQADNDFYVGDTIDDVSSYVWDDNYLSVLHLNDIVTHYTGYTNLSIDNFLDVTSYNNHGRNYNVYRRRANYSFDSLQFIGSTSDYILIGNLGSAAEGTVEFGMCSDINKTATDLRNPFSTYLNGSNNAVRFEETLAGQLGVYIGDGSYTSSSHTVSGTGGFDRVSFAWSSTTGSGYGYYRDVYTWEMATPYIPTNFTNVVAGNGYTTSRAFYGRLEEIRISNVQRSPAWLKATHYTTENELLTFTEEHVPVLTYICEGEVVDWAGPVSSATIRSFKRSTGNMIDEVLTTSSGTFQVQCLDTTDHFITAFNPGTGVNAIIYDRVTPSGVLI